MGFNQCYLRGLEDLKAEFNKSGLESFVKRYQKYDSLTGSSESFEFLESKIKEYEQITISTDIIHNRM
jgi:TfoX/Sxy family transcriptional regulator of competence genes